jgi:Fic family protein
MGEASGLRVGTSTALKERRLQALLAGRPSPDEALRAAVEDAQLLGSLELAGIAVTWDEVQAARRGEPAAESIVALRRAQRAVAAGEPFGVAALRAWSEALFPGAAGFRKSERTREGTAPAPPAFVESRLAILEGWLRSEGGAALKPLAQAALALARIVEILPFEDGNGRVARLAASHLLVAGGLRPPILVGGDAARLRTALAAAFRFETEALVALLDEATGRSLDVMIQTLERG